MNIVLLDQNIAFAPQLNPEHIAEIAKHGFEQLICSRLDNEEIGQPTFAIIEAEAKKNDLTMVFAPVANGHFSEETIEVAQNALQSNKKTVMFCRSGMRSSVLWAIIQTRQGKPITETIDSLSTIGFNISHMREYINEIANKH